MINIFYAVRLTFVVVSILNLAVLNACSPKSVISNAINDLLMPTCEKANIQFSTTKSPIPSVLDWKEIGFAKELINQFQKIVVFSGGSNPIPLSDWDNFKPFFPWQKNINRNLLFQKTAFLRSPDTDANCQGSNCIKQRDYKGYTWIDIAEPTCVEYVPGKTDILMPSKGYVVIKTIKKCQALYYENFIYQLSDNQGNFYVMHAFENGFPNMSVELPTGWSVKNVTLNSPLIVSPFGGGNNCFFNILGDSLGQGYHQYIFAGSIYPNK